MPSPGSKPALLRDALLALTALLALCASACGEGGDAAPLPGCRLHSDCSIDQICNEGRCVAPTPCGDAETCACRADIECGAGRRCDPGVGRCSVVECSANRDCALGERCLEGRCLTDVDADRDRDGVPDGSAGAPIDTCPDVPDPEQLDSDGDGLGDACDEDDDGDLVGDSADTCPLVADPDQADADGDGLGNACDGDWAGTTVRGRLIKRSMVAGELRDARIRLLGVGIEADAAVGADGAFAFSGLQRAGFVQLVLDWPAWRLADGTRLHAVDTGSAENDLGEITVVHTSELGEAAVAFSGQVVLSGREDHSGATVRLRYAANGQLFATTLTDADGSFAALAAREEAYTLEVSHPDFQTERGLGPFRWDAEQARFVDDAGAAPEIALGRGEARGAITVRLDVEPGWLPGAEASGWLTVGSSDGATLLDTQLAADGVALTFEGLPLGEYLIQAHRIGFAPSSRIVRVTESNAAPAVALELRLIDLGAAQLDLRGVRLAAADLAPLRLVGADLSGIAVTGDLGGLNLRRARFSGADLRGVRFDMSDLVGADFAYALLDGASMRGVDAAGASFFGAQAPGVELEGASLVSADFTGSSLIGARFSALELDDLSTGDPCAARRGLADVELTGARFTDAELSEARLVGANLSGAALSGARLHRAQLDGVCLEGAELTLADLDHTGLRGARLGGARLINAVLDGADLSGATLAGANLATAVLQGTLLRGAELSGAIFTGATLSNADLGCAEEDALAVFEGTPGTPCVDRYEASAPDPLPYGRHLGLDLCRGSRDDLSDTYTLALQSDGWIFALIEGLPDVAAALGGGVPLAVRATPLGGFGLDLQGYWTLPGGHGLAFVAYSADAPAAGRVQLEISLQTLEDVHATYALTVFTRDALTAGCAQPTELSRADFSGAVLAGVRFDGARLDRAVFRGAVVTASNRPPTIQPIDCALPEDCTWDDVLADFERVQQDAELFTACYDAAPLQCRLTRTSFRGATLDRAVAAGAELLEVDLVGARLRGADLSNTRFANTLLLGADLSDAVLAGVAMPGELFAGVQASGADLSGLAWEGTQVIFSDLSATAVSFTASRETALAFNDLRGADLRGIVLAAGVDLRGNLLDGADLSDARLAGARFSDWSPSLPSGGFNPCPGSWEGALLDRADLSGANLGRCELRQVSLRGADLTGANLADATLYQSELACARFGGTSVRGADLTCGRFGARAQPGCAIFDPADLLLSADTTCPDGAAAQCNVTICGCSWYAGQPAIPGCP